MATNSRSDGSNYQSRSSAWQEQRQEQREEKERNNREDKINEYLKSHPSASWVEAKFNANKR